MERRKRIVAFIILLIVVLIGFLIAGIFSREGGIIFVISAVMCTASLVGIAFCIFRIDSLSGPDYEGGRRKDGKEIYKLH